MKENFLCKINKKTIKLIIRFVLLVICVFAFISPVIFDGVSFLTRVVMFTGLSNSLLVFQYLLLIIFTFLKFDLRSKRIYIFRFIVTSCITLTFIVFGFVLTPASIATGEFDPFKVSSLFQHFIAPPLAIAEFLLLDPVKEKIKRIHSFHSLDVSLVYLVAIEIRGAVSNAPHIKAGGVDSRYPYFLLDPYFMGFWFEGGTLNIHLGIIPILVILIGLDLLLGFCLLEVKNKISSKFIWGNTANKN